MNEAQLIKTIKAHIAKGEQHYISAGLHLAKLKERCPDQATFLALVKEKIGIGKSRTYELLQIADGRKTVDEVRADTADRQERHRLSVTNGQDRKPDNAPGDTTDAVARLQEAVDALVERDLALGLIEKPKQESAASWRVRVTDDSGKVWVNGVRLAGKDEAARYISSAAYDFRREEAPPVEVHVLPSTDKWNMKYARYSRGPAKGRITDGGTLLFEHGTCGLFEWHEEGQEPSTACELPAVDDGLDIPENLRRAS
jgi:hypothetical protein